MYHHECHTVRLYSFMFLTFPSNTFNCSQTTLVFFSLSHTVCDISLSLVIGWASFSVLDRRINLLSLYSFMEIECPWLEFAAHLLSFTQGYLLKSMPSHPLHLSGCLTGPEAGFLLDTAWIMKCGQSGGDRQWVITLVQHGWGRCSCFIMSNVAEGKPRALEMLLTK